MSTRGRAIGSVTDAMELLGLETSADVWWMAVDGTLDADRDDESQPWTIYEVLD